MTSLNTCRHTDPLGGQCGLPEWNSNTSVCQFHILGNVTPNETERLLIYLEQIKDREIIDLSDVNFEKFNFSSLPKSFFGSRPIYFDYSKFKKCVFESIILKRDISFFNSTFDDTKFRNTEFRGNTINFVGARFDGNTIPFGNCVFHLAESVRFGQSKFSSKSSPFSRSCMKTRKVDFQHAEISADKFYIFVTDESAPVYNDHYLVINAEEIFFEHLNLEGHFSYTNGTNNLSPSPIVTFSLINFSQMKSGTFVNANLENARFIYSKIDNVYFANVKWRKQNGKLILYDEFNRADKHDIEDVRRIYVQLKRNYEENRDYRNAGDWFYREQEIVRKNLASNRGRIIRILRQHIFSFYPMYKYISNYGESFTRPFGWLIGVLLFFGYCYNILSLATFSEPLLCTFLEGLKFSFLVMTFQYTKRFEVISEPIFFLSVFQILLTAILVPLFLLALRRRFRR